MSVLLLDIGNSTTVSSIYDGSDLTTIQNCLTTDIKSFLDKLDLNGIQRFVVSSVVPHLNELIQSYFHNIYFISSDSIPYLSIDIESPLQVGADRLVTALAAHALYKRECLIVDSGTAVTFERVSKDCRYLGGAIFPGMGIASKSLHDYTAQIPLIWVEKCDDLIGGSTQAAVESGLFHGYQVMINGMIQKFKQETPDLYVIGAGNGLAVFEDFLDIDCFDSYLQLRGLAIVSDSLNV